MPTMNQYVFLFSKIYAVSRAALLWRSPHKPIGNNAALNRVSDVIHVPRLYLDHTYSSNINNKVTILQPFTIIIF